MLWRETSAQHFPTGNGYWPGVKYATNMKLQCVPIQDTTPQADWRNRIIEQIILKHNFFTVQIIRFYNLTLPLWSAHPNGKLRDCTHFCWFPMLYQSIFHQLNDVAQTLLPKADKKSSSNSHNRHQHFGHKVSQSSSLLR